jgi:hypothetical protein
MPEAFAVFLIFVIAIAAWFGAWLSSRNPANYRPIEEAARLEQHAAWLKQRLEVAQRENWDDEMIAPLAAELEAISRELRTSAADRIDRET